MNRKVIALILGASLVVPSANSAWFEKNTPLTQAHQHLLNNELPSMFDSLVEVWQSQHTKSLDLHLNNLLLQSLNVDCGKGLSEQPFPDWIQSVTIRNIEIQSPGREAYQLIVDAVTDNQIRDISLTKWVNSSISQDSTFNQLSSDGVTNDALTYIKRYNLASPLDIGLYRLIITKDDSDSWSTWVILSHSGNNNSVYWVAKDQWDVKRTALQNPYCPLPKLNVSIYQYVDGKYKEKWHKSYESDYPSSLESNILPPNRYVLAVSMNQQRWQGPIAVENSQVISKTYDISNDE
ncbi:DUF2861 family protein [Vibrio salinus]|uniref:DUF2861 family protein n=1 Tax=Vibrio salinus TaxID=2899784 RepID=UPI001E497F59|nr:DUF2861 family protein [Vibrio salinus]MCE0495812.1 DUF2861 family protein [Vibrio salinus]